MFLRATKRFKDGKVHYYWSMVENVRVGRRVFQRQALYLGELIGPGALTGRSTLYSCLDRVIWNSDEWKKPRGEDGRRRHADDRRADRHPAALCRTEAGSGDSAGSARTDVARPAPAEDLKRSCRRGEIDCVVKTYEQNPSNRWGFARERGKSG